MGVPTLGAALWKAAERRGSKLLRVAARSIVRTGATLRVELEDGPIEAPHVVVAAGCWAGQIELAGPLRLPVRPVRGQLLGLMLEGAPLIRRLIAIAGDRGRSRSGRARAITEAHASGVHGTALRGPERSP